MTKEQLYSKLMDQLEALHRENLTIINLILLTAGGVDDAKREQLLENIDIAFKRERNKW